jgi:di/tricarboxylate transporter
MKIVFLFGGTLALASALDSTGAGATLANGVIGALGDHASPFVLLTAVFLIALVLTNFMSNTATTALLVPIGMSIATNIGADPRAVLIATVLGSSMALATPIGCPSNTMVYSVGGYKFTDYVKAGLPITIINAIVALILLPIFFPFFPG